MDCCSTPKKELDHSTFVKLIIHLKSGSNQEFIEGSFLLLKLMQNINDYNSESRDTLNTMVRDYNSRREFLEKRRRLSRQRNTV